MNKQKTGIPEISASNFKDAQDYIHDWKLNQWRMTTYLEALDQLPKKGVMPTDTSIARFISDKRTPAAVQISLRTLHIAGLVDITGQTSLGSSYKLSHRGELAVVQSRQVVAKWNQIHADKVPTPEPNYAKSFERLNHEIKVQRQTIDSQAETIRYQKEVIGSLRQQLAAVREPEAVVSHATAQEGRKSMADPLDY